MDDDGCTREREKKGGASLLYERGHNEGQEQPRACLCKRMWVARGVRIIASGASINSCLIERSLVPPFFVSVTDLKQFSSFQASRGHINTSDAVRTTLSSKNKNNTLSTTQSMKIRNSRRRKGTHNTRRQCRASKQATATDALQPLCFDLALTCTSSVHNPILVPIAILAACRVKQSISSR